jgi:uncharacterized membrane protein YGL010W
MKQIARRQVDALLATYAEAHRHPVNEVIHCICVPAIVFALLGLIWAIHPLLAIAIAAISLIYYAWLSSSFALGMLLMFSAMSGVLYLLPQPLVLEISIAVFVIAWIGQFVGHGIEGKRPSFFEDLRYLLIGPLFVLGFLYRRLNLHY